MVTHLIKYILEVYTSSESAARGKAWLFARAKFGGGMAEQLLFRDQVHKLFSV
jgi:hypothetical protein